MANILVIEDDPSMREFIQTILGGAGHAVRVAGTGLNGLLSARLKKPDLILLDMGLPELDGYAVAKELRASGQRGVPILAVTAHDHAEDYDAAYQAGCTGFLAKPLTEERLLQAIADQLAKK